MRRTADGDPLSKRQSRSSSLGSRIEPRYAEEPGLDDATAATFAATRPNSLASIPGQ
jgi:hypothetical protein